MRALITSLWQLCWSVCSVNPSNNFCLPLLLGCTAGSAPQHLAPLTQNASSSSRRVSPLCSIELIAALSRDQVEALGVNKTVLTVKSQGKIPRPADRGEEKLLSFWLKTCLSTVIAWLFEFLPESVSLSIIVTTVLLTVLLFPFQARLFFCTLCVQCILPPERNRISVLMYFLLCSDCKSLIM